MDARPTGRSAYDLLSSIIIRINPVSVAPTAHHNVIAVRKIIGVCVGSELFLIISEIARNRCGIREKTPPTNTAIGGLSALSKAVASRRLRTFHQLVSFNPISLGARMSNFIFAGGAVAVLVILWLIGREVLRKLAPPKSQ